MSGLLLCLKPSNIFIYPLQFQTWLDIEFQKAYLYLRLARDGVILILFIVSQAKELSKYNLKQVCPNTGFKEQLLRWEKSKEREELSLKLKAERGANEKAQSLYESDLKTLQGRQEEVESK